jgi:tryptophan 2,3-dioxygenase
MVPWSAITPRRGWRSPGVHQHLKTVELIIGGKTGTGGSSGTGFLRAALDLRFFGELCDVLTEIGR